MIKHIENTTHLNLTLRSFIGFICVTFVAATFSLLLDFVRIKSEFKKDVIDVNRIFTQRLSSIETVLTSLTGLHHASDDLNPAELSSFSSEILSAYPFIQAILSMKNISLEDVEKFEKRMHKQGYVSLKVKIKDHRVHGDRHFYLPVNFIEPMTPRSASLLGLDIRSLPKLLLAIDYAIKTGEVAASPITSKLDPKNPSMLIFKALYLGRYPPSTVKQRWFSLDGLVALQIDTRHLMDYLSLDDYGITGSIGNLTTTGLSAAAYKFSLDGLGYRENFSVYEQNYQFSLNRPVTLQMVNKVQMLIIWLFSIVMFGLIWSISKKRMASIVEINFLAYYDRLTSLPNRESFKIQLKRVLNQALNNSTTGAVLYIDIDDFKRINDTLGHDLGDELLKQMSIRLTDLIQQDIKFNQLYKGNFGDIIARIGGDEFTILLDDVKDENIAGLVADLVMESLCRPFTLHHHEIYITTSIGIALFPKDGGSVDMVLRHADIAKHHVKGIGKNNYKHYTNQLSLRLEQRHKLEDKLRKAISKNELQLYYQPQVDVKTHKVIAAEALIRWDQSELGMILPNEFIPLAEETGQIFKIGEWVIREACSQAVKWQNAGYDSIRIAVNLSALQFSRGNIGETINSILTDTGLSPEYLELEITESITMRSVDQAVSVIQEFSDSGIGVTIDDFGTGYSSLSYLRKFSLQSLKIDRSFVMDIPEDKDSMMITSAIISMASSLGLTVIAEGVETQEQLDYLESLRCDLIQGYYFGRPVPAQEFEKILTR